MPLQRFGGMRDLCRPLPDMNLIIYIYISIKPCQEQN